MFANSSLWVIYSTRGAGRGGGEGGQLFSAGGANRIKAVGLSILLHTYKYSIFNLKNWRKLFLQFFNFSIHCLKSHFSQLAVSKCSLIYHWHVCDISQRKVSLINHKQFCDSLRTLFLCDLSLMCCVSKCFVADCGKNGSCLLYHISSMKSLWWCLLYHVSCLLSHISSLTSLVSRLLSHVVILFTHELWI